MMLRDTLNELDYDDDTELTEDERLWNDYIAAAECHRKIAQERDWFIRNAKRAEPAEIERLSLRASAAADRTWQALRRWNDRDGQKAESTSAPSPSKGGRRRTKGAKCNTALSQDAINAICADYQSDMNRHDVAAKHGISVCRLHRIVRRERDAGRMPHTAKSQRMSDKNRRPIYCEIIDYRLAHPNASTAQVAEALGAAITTVRSATTRAYEAGYRVDEVRNAFSRFAQADV